MSATDLDRYLTEEVAEKAARAEWEHEWPERPWEMAPDYFRDFYISVARASLSAVLPAIIRQAKAEAIGERAAEMAKTSIYNARAIGQTLSRCVDLIEQASRGEPLPVVNHKGPCDTDASIFRTMAEKMRRDEPVGGSNARDALARLIDREVARADRIEQGGRP